MKLLNRAEEGVLALSMFLSALLAFINVLFRMFGGGIVWSEEMVRYLIILLTFIGVSTGVREGSQYCIDLLPSIVKGKGKLILTFVIGIIGTVFSVLMIYYGIMAVQFTQGTNQASPSLRIPMYLVYCIIPVAGVLILLRYISQLYSLCIGKRDEE